ncbi:hypothetical protein SAMN04490182_2025 [Pseudomonas cedrina]|uniref:Morphogenetic protein n=2 Tax=Pseudomonas cedrina TaxID=651740 RepID=A0A1V2JZK9_PSECE|nr:hypothetical protein [Pseudomonas cedrina]ONH50932.1 hypothetical protein BLL36_23775 [Pseudomonas cedrina subsp. cedrina]SDS64119.1 hypothetical protein SAMN04490182_2025 [Pseudomonas cedrina]
MTQVKERPILLSAPMVRAILEGRKTVTRRPVKFPFIDRAVGCELSGNEIGPDEIRNNCPYGVPGQRLWVRETWARVGNSDPGYLTFGATYPACLPPELENIPAASEIRWKPSIHMFRRDSRILLEITAVRVERLQDITEDQAKAEGVRLYTDHAELGDWWHVEGINTYSADPRKSFELLWSSVGGDWVANPWVWVVEFKKIGIF